MLREEKYNDEEKYQDIEVPKVLSPAKKLSLAKPIISKIGQNRNELSTYIPIENARVELLFSKLQAHYANNPKTVDECIAEYQQQCINRIKKNGCYKNPELQNEIEPLLEDNELRTARFDLYLLNADSSGEEKRIEKWRDAGMDAILDNRVLFIKRGDRYTFYLRCEDGTYKEFELNFKKFWRIGNMASRVVEQLFSQCGQGIEKVFDSRKKRLEKIEIQKSGVSQKLLPPYYSLIEEAKILAGYPTQHIFALRLLKKTVLEGQRSYSYGLLDIPEKRNIQLKSVNHSIESDLTLIELFRLVWLAALEPDPKKASQEISIDRFLSSMFDIVVAHGVEGHFQESACDPGKVGGLLKAVPYWVGNDANFAVGIENIIEWSLESTIETIQILYGSMSAKEQFLLSNAFYKHFLQQDLSAPEKLAVKNFFASLCGSDNLYLDFAKKKHRELSSEEGIALHHSDIAPLNLLGDLPPPHPRIINILTARTLNFEKTLKFLIPKKQLDENEQKASLDTTIVQCMKLITNLGAAPEASKKRSMASYLSSEQKDEINAGLEKVIASKNLQFSKKEKEMLCLELAYSCGDHRLHNVRMLAIYGEEERKRLTLFPAELARILKYVAKGKWRTPSDFWIDYYSFHYKHPLQHESGGIPEPIDSVAEAILQSDSFEEEDRLALFQQGLYLLNINFVECDTLDASYEAYVRTIQKWSGQKLSIARKEHLLLIGLGLDQNSGHSSLEKMLPFFPILKNFLEKFQRSIPKTKDPEALRKYPEKMRKEIEENSKSMHKVFSDNEVPVFKHNLALFNRCTARMDFAAFLIQLFKNDAELLKIYITYSEGGDACKGEEILKFLWVAQERPTYLHELPDALNFFLDCMRDEEPKNVSSEMQAILMCCRSGASKDNIVSLTEDQLNEIFCQATFQSSAWGGWRNTWAVVYILSFCWIVDGLLLLLNAKTIYSHWFEAKEDELVQYALQHLAEPEKAKSLAESEGYQSLSKSSKSTTIENVEKKLNFV